MRLEVFVVPVKKVEVMEPEMNAFLRAPRVPVGRVCPERAEGVAAPHDTGINPAAISRRQRAPGRSPNSAPAARHVYSLASQTHIKPQRGGM